MNLFIDLYYLWLRLKLGEATVWCMLHRVLLRYHIHIPRSGAASEVISLSLRVLLNFLA